jgi:oligopeptide/dipeptide ABC transporter ATP-binding protein
MKPPVLHVEGLCVDLVNRNGSAPVVDGVSFALAAGETLAIVGESGCGKSVTALSLLKLVDAPLAITRGSVRIDGEDLLLASEQRLRALRGQKIAMIFQEPMSALNPVLTVGDQIAEGMRLHLALSRRDARTRTLELMREVGIADVEKRIDEYPHQLSGGMRQRVMIAMALGCSPDVLLADEPTTALDVTVQAQILALLRGIQQDRGLAIVLITHDLGVVAEMADRVAVMYAGRIVEETSVARLFDAPAHPYTQALFRSRPHLAKRGERLATIEGVVPGVGRFPPGCRFHPRCGEARDECRVAPPSTVILAGGHRVECFARKAAP